MPPRDILSGIEKVLALHLGHVGPIHEAMPLVETFRLDSVRLLTLVVELENHFQVNLEDGDEQGLESVGDLVHLLARRLGDRAADPSGALDGNEGTDG